MTEPISFILIAPPEPEININIDDIHAIHTDNEEIQCCICYDIKQNIKFIPCNHTHTCSECYKSLSKKECPICKKYIFNIIKI